ncbi:unnamed protein product [Zymoseptoria tritici ST99CH_3D1]|nr:unnamed protein product [Zymoseptoria tritici ST99CH_3D1]
MFLSMINLIATLLTLLMAVAAAPLTSDHGIPRRILQTSHNTTAVASINQKTYDLLCYNACRAVPHAVATSAMDRFCSAEVLFSVDQSTSGGVGSFVGDVWMQVTSRPVPGCPLNTNLDAVSCRDGFVKTIEGCDVGSDQKRGGFWIGECVVFHFNPHPLKCLD